ncbi:MAG TPA: TaqI-like C-terminal specificity domain-containing protein, partial [bacterium]|nr:TaqI-like C-terminal specificity domain-containing protein [bacterium]
GVLLSPHLNILLSLNSIQRVIGDDFSVENPFSTSEAYEIEKIVEDAKVFDDCFKLLTTGSIDPYISMWGVKTTSYLKSKYIFPVIKSSVLKKHFPRRFAQQSCKKIILSGMRHFEAYFDSEGEFLASKSTIMIKNISDNQSGYFLTAILNSNLIKFYIKESYSSMGIDGGINFSKDMVAMIPLKTEPSKVKKTAEIVAEIISAKKQDIFANTTDLEKQIDKMVYELYGLTEEEIRIVEGGE